MLCVFKYYLLSVDTAKDPLEMSDGFSKSLKQISKFVEEKNVDQITVVNSKKHLATLSSKIKEDESFL